MNSPTVSVVIPAYNAEDTIARAIESVMTQTVDVWEIIVVDDGSTDQTNRIVGEYKRKLGDRLLLIEQGNHGSSAARNTGINAAGRTYTAFLDADDEYFPDKLQRQLSLFRRRPDLGLVYSDYSFVDLEGRNHQSAFDEKLLLARAVSSTEVAGGLHVCDGRFFETLLRGYFIATITGMVRRDVLADNVRFHERISYAEEWLFYLQVARATLSGFVNEPLCLHHFTKGSLSRTDRAQNAIGLCEVLHAILEAFPEMQRSQRRIVQGMLGRAHRQVAYNAGQSGAHGESARRFLRSFCCQPRRATLCSAVAALVRACFAGESHRMKSDKYPVRSST